MSSANQAPLPGQGRVRGKVAVTLREHWVFASLLAAGLLLRVATQVAYQPALLYIDSKKYLFGEQVQAWGAFDPMGYTLAVLRPVLLVTNLAAVAVLQHVLGLVIAVAIYALLRRLGVPGWLAALAAAPVLLDAYQLVAEQTVMPDALFEALVVAGLLLLLWWPRPGLLLAAAAGLALGASAPVRQVGEALILPAVCYVLVATGGRLRTRLLHGAVLAACFALPIIGYMTYSQLGLHDGFELSDMGDEYLYGRAAHAADCAALVISQAERPLCPKAAVAAAIGVDGLVNTGLTAGQTYPGTVVQPPPGVSLGTMQRDFAYAVLRQQPLRVAGDITGDAVKLFALTRDGAQGDTPISRWQFQDGYPYYPPGITETGATSANVIFMLSGGGSTHVVTPVARALRGYQLHGGYTPGPVFGLALLAGLAGVFGYRRLREPRLALACALFTTAGVVLVLGADLYEFSWRYQLPALVTFPAAGALGAVAVARLAKHRKQAVTVNNNSSGEDELANVSLA